MKTVFNKIRRGRKRAETILEVLVAIFIVAIGSTASTSLVVDALQSNGLSRDNLIALNLAVEGQEALRDIRDSNWLKFSYNRDDCWNMMPAKSTCASADLINAGNYMPSLDTDTMSWELVAADTPLDLTDTNKKSSNDKYLLSLADVYPTVDSDGDGDPRNERDMYLVASETAFPKVSTKFYRMVTIGYDANPATAETMTVTSVVQWKERGYHQVKLVSKLTDYLKIKVN